MGKKPAVSGRALMKLINKYCDIARGETKISIIACHMGLSSTMPAHKIRDNLENLLKMEKTILRHELGLYPAVAIAKLPPHWRELVADALIDRRILLRELEAILRRQLGYAVLREVMQYEHDIKLPPDLSEKES